MDHSWLALAGTLLPALALAPGAHAGSAPAAPGPYARIALLRPHDGRTVDFEAGYVRHLEWHRQAKDPWTWYGWSIWAGDRQRWFVYATFGRTAAELDAPVAPAEDEKDNVLNVVPHATFAGNALYEFLPALSQGTGVPEPSPRAELTTIELAPGAGPAFEAALAAAKPALRGETLWFRMLAGGAAPRYVRLRARPALSAILEGARAGTLPAEAERLVGKATVEILAFRPTMSYTPDAR